MMLEPEELTEDFDRMIELKCEGMRGDPQREAKTWVEELTKLERMRDGYYDQAAEGLMSLDKPKESSPPWRRGRLPPNESYVPSRGAKRNGSN